MSPEERTARAIGIRALLDDANVKAGLADIRGELMEEWTRCFDPAERENLWRAVHTMTKLEQWLRARASGGPSSAEMQALRRT